MSHELIYQHIWNDKTLGGTLWKHLRQSTKKRRKRYNSKDSRGRLAAKRHITERPAKAEHRNEPGHWEIDTVVGPRTKALYRNFSRQNDWLHFYRANGR